MENSAIENMVLEIIRERNEKTTPSLIEKRVMGISGAKRRDVKKAVNRLVSTGELEYTYHFGNSCLEKSFNRPVRASENVVLKPSAANYDPVPGDVVVSLDRGASFGAGDHPTTRLSLRAMEKIKKETEVFEKENARMLDIGTGSGVLALAALKMGARLAWGTDIDPCARDEARKNAKLNGLEERFRVFEGDLTEFEFAFDLIAANLRFPTLAVLSGTIAKLCLTGGAAAFSGVRPDEFVELAACYGKLGFECVWSAEEKGWAGGAFLKR